MSVNQKQIASALALSVATVSRALKGDYAISAPTRAQVLEMAGKLGYNPTISNRPRRDTSPKTNEERAICVLIQSDETSYATQSSVARFLAGMSVAAEELKHPLLVHYIALNNREHAHEPDKLPAPLRDGRAAGAILLHYYPQEVVKQMAFQFPCVSMIYDYRTSGVDVIGVNETELVAKMTGELLENGHRRIGFAGNLPRHIWAQRRFAGYIMSHATKGLSHLPELVFHQESPRDADARYDTMAAAVRSGMTALVAANDEVGYSIIHAMKLRGIRVPEDLSITGFDGVDAPLGMPVLRSARLPVEDMGFAAVRTLMERCQYAAMPIRQILIDCNDVEGASVSRP